MAKYRLLIFLYLATLSTIDKVKLILTFLHLPFSNHMQKTNKENQSKLQSSDLNQFNWTQFKIEHDK